MGNFIGLRSGNAFLVKIDLRKKGLCWRNLHPEAVEFNLPLISVIFHTCTFTLPSQIVAFPPYQRYIAIERAINFVASSIDPTASKWQQVTVFIVQLPVSASVSLSICYASVSQLRFLQFGRCVSPWPSARATQSFAKTVASVTRRIRRC